MPASNEKMAGPGRFGAPFYDSPLAGYVFALGASALAFALRFEVDRWIGDRISLPLCGLAAVIACIWLAGFAPSLAATAITAGWYIYDAAGSGSGGPYSWIRYVLYVTEALVVCVYGRQLRVEKDRAAKGEQWQRHLVETAGEGIWMINSEGIIAYANPRIAEILGCGVDQIVGRHLEDFLFPEDLLVERIRQQNRRTGVREQLDRRLRRADGSEVWVLACSSLYQSGKTDTDFLTMMTDITERKNAEQALRRSERKYRELFENLLEGVYQTSPDGRILAANPELLRMLGFSSPEELNVPGVVRDTFVEADMLQNLRDRLERDGSYANVEFQLRTRDHRIITVRENARAVRDENGEVLYYEGTLTDITDQIRIAKQLRQAQNMEALGRLAGGIARDFRSIGADMANNLQHALDALPRGSPVRTRLDTVARSIYTAEALTGQILDFSLRPINSPDHYGDDTVIDLNFLVHGLQPILSGLAGPEDSLAISLCETPAPVLADPGHLRQILAAFIDRVREIGSGAKKKISLTTSIQKAGPEECPGPVVSLSVDCRGNDIGQSEDIQPWIGMATTEAILAQYGGVMTAAVEPSSEGFGSAVRYSLSLPLASVAAVERSRPNPAATAVLVVEEEPLIRELSRDMLERQGFRVLTAGTIAEAERIARGEIFDVLVTAWENGDARGMALIRLLREIRPGLRVLLLAGKSEVSPEAGLPQGCAVLQKPFSGDALGQRVRQLLDKAAAAEA